jgi:hypothetical protein
MAALPPGSLQAASASKATVSFVISIPKKSSASSAKRPSYVSPATQAMTLAISGPTTVNQTAALTPTSGGCASTLASTQCTLQVALTPGSYTATLTTYDGYDAGTQTATGNVLSTGQNVGFTIHPGQANTIALVLSGVPVQLVVIPLTPLSTPNGSGSYHLVGAGVHPFLVEALDADGNVIVGSGAPTFTIGAPSGTVGATATPPTSTKPNQFTLTPPATFASGTATFAVTAGYAGQPTDGCAQPGAVCGPVNVTVDMVRALVVANCGTCNSSGPDSIAIYADGGNAPLQTITGSAINGPQDLITDAAGDIFVYNANLGTTREFVAPSLAPGPTIPFPGGVMAIASDGTLYLGDRLGLTDNIAAYRPPYTGAPVATFNPTGGVFSNLGGLLVAPNGDLWVSDPHNAFVWKFTAPISGSPSPTVTLTGMGLPTQLALDPSGNLFVGVGQSYRLEEYTPPISTGAHPSLQVTNWPFVPMALIIDAAGRQYVSAFAATGCFCGTLLYRVSPGTTTVQITINAADTNANTVPRFLAFGASGIYTTNLGGNSVDEFNLGLTARINTITTGINQPYAIAIEP